MRNRAAALVPAVAAAGMIASTAIALDWGLINPGETTREAVRTRYGAPSKDIAQKVDDYDARQWVYEGARAPAGMTRLTVDFGLLTPAGYRAELVRSFLLEPKPGLFTRKTVLDGWGIPTGVGQHGDAPAFLYEEGLFVYFDASGWEVRSMLFTPRQRIPEPTAPGSPPPPPSPPPR